MSKETIKQKIDLTSKFEKKIKDAKSFLVFEYLGLSVKELTIMRSKLHLDGASIEIIKNNILNRALKANKIDVDECKGPNAIIISNDDEICGFKVVNEIAQEKKFVKFKFGFLENKIIKPDQLSLISSIPGRNGLYSMFLSCLIGGIRNFLYGLNAIIKTKQQ